MNEPAPAPVAPRKSASLLRLFVLVGIAAALFMLLLQGGLVALSGGLAIGQPAPPLKAEGWLNGTPTAEQLGPGRVYVVEAWATWCLPCRQEAPALIRVYEQFEERGVTFVGLTAEPRKARRAMEQYLEQTHVPWPVGYGAAETLIQYQAERIPMIWVIGADGKVAWNLDSPLTLAEGIEQALTTAGQ